MFYFVVFFLINYLIWFNLLIHLILVDTDELPTYLSEALANLDFDEEECDNIELSLRDPNYKVYIAFVILV